MGGSLSALYFFAIFLEIYTKVLTIYRKRYIIKSWKGDKNKKEAKPLERRNGTMGKKKKQKKKPINWQELAISAVIDLIIGTILIIIGKYIG